jgi:UMF1 family MFS transporter
MLVQLFTSLFKTQQAGFIPIAAMMVIGFVILLFVKGGQRDTTL